MSSLVTVKEIFHEGKAVYGKHVGIFLCFFLPPYKVNIPMYAGEFFLCYFLVPYKVNIPMYARGFKQVQYKEYICWMQVKIYISDQTSLRICYSVIKVASLKKFCISCIFG